MLTCFSSMSVKDESIGACLSEFSNIFPKHAMSGCLDALFVDACEIDIFISIHVPQKDPCEVM
jgi:hypothetical protein